MSAPCKPNEIRLIREYQAPLAEVWEAWADVKLIAQWWGPRGFSLTTHSKSLKAGGNWKYTMHSPAGVDYPNIAVYHEVEPLKRLVYDHGGNEESPPLFRVTVEFTEENGVTTVDMTFALATAEAAQNTRRFIKEAAGNTTWDRLAEFLAKRKQNKDVFVINHSFDASPDTVYEMWTNPEHLQEWLPPRGFDMKWLRSEIKEGASTFFTMFNKDGVELYCKTHYLHLIPSRQIIMKQEFCDESENLSRHPLAPNLPQTIVSTVDFCPEGEGTRITLTSISGDDSTAQEVAAFIEERAGMSQGWGSSFDELEDRLN